MKMEFKLSREDVVVMNLTKQIKHDLINDYNLEFSEAQKYILNSTFYKMKKEFPNDVLRFKSSRWAREIYYEQGSEFNWSSFTL